MHKLLWSCHERGEEGQFAGWLASDGEVGGVAMNTKGDKVDSRRRAAPKATHRRQGARGPSAGISSGASRKKFRLCKRDAARNAKSASVL
jgi:hypothetical protein